MVNRSHFKLPHLVLIVVGEGTDHGNLPWLVPACRQRQVFTRQ
jgi:hypothetical protein